jgi:hypothetical protein
MDKRDVTTKAGLLLGLIVTTMTAAFLSGCVVAAGPREGYWDREHHRWWHEHAWVACVGPADEHCR